MGIQIFRKTGPIYMRTDHANILTYEFIQIGNLNSKIFSETLHKKSLKEFIFL